MCAPYTELEKPLEDYAMLCRSCLAGSGEMKNIFEWGLADDFCNVTDIQLSQGECMSELLCVACEDMLLSCKRFKLQCLKSDRMLRNTAKKIPPSKPTFDEDLQSTQTKENTISSILHDKKLVIKITAPDMESKIHLACVYCQSSFIKQRDLLLHLVKTHKLKTDDISIDLHYYCSFNSCSYHVNSGKNKYFPGRKYLNQHFIKVHMSKVFHCDICSSSFATDTEFNRHLKTCNVMYLCEICDIKYKTNERLLVHLMRKHPDLHDKYKKQTKSLKRKSKTLKETKKPKSDEKIDFDRRFDEFRSIWDSPKRSFATQTLIPEDNIKNDVTLSSWQIPSKSDAYETKTDEISTQTVFEDLLSLKSQTSEDESIFFSETVSLSDIQTQTFPLEFGLSRSNKETITSETQSPDLSIKETQTCFCLYDSPKTNFPNRLFESVSSSPSSINLTSTETQTAELRSSVKSDVLLSFNSAETQTSFEDGKDSL